MLNARYDLMGDDELTNALVIWEASTTGSENAQGTSEKPLFPPSSTDKEHPMKVLARIGWRLWKLEAQRVERKARVHVQKGAVGGRDQDQVWMFLFFFWFCWF